MSDSPAPKGSRKLSRRKFLLGSVATAVGAAVTVNSERANAFFNTFGFMKKPAGSGQTSNGYTIGQSLRFNGSSTYLRRTPGTVGNQQTWTLSCWVKRSGLSDGGVIFASSTSGTDASWLYFQASTDALYWQDYVGGSRLEIKTNAAYRDTAAWYHIVIALDTTQSNSTNRAKMFVNGSQITNFATATYPSQNASLLVNTANRSHTVGVTDYNGGTLSNYFNGYISEVNFIDGQALDASSFGQVDTQTGQWIPKRYTDTYGTNGFYLDFSNGSVLGRDAAGTSTSTGLTGSSWSGATGSFTFSGYDIVATTGDRALKSAATLSGDFDIYFKINTKTACIGVWDLAQDASFNQNAELINSLSASFWAIRIGGASNSADFYYGASQITACPSWATGDVFRLSRRGSTFYGYQNGVLRHTFSQTSSATVRIGFSTGGSFLASVKNFYVRDGSVGAFGNDFDWSNFRDADQVLDSPTNNFCTWNPLDKDSTFTTSKGNLYCSGAGADTAIRATHGVSTDKWYWECTIRNNNYGWTTGIGNTLSPLNGTNMHLNANNWFFDPYNGQSTNTSWTSIASSTAAVGDTIMVAIDLGSGTGSGKIWWGKNGTWFASGAPASGTGAQYSNLSGVIMPMFDRSSGSVVDCEVNFGQGGQTGLTYNSASGGRFKYTPPAGFKALSTANLAAPAIKKPGQYFDILTYTGDATAGRAITGLGFAPDLVWGKNRDVAQHHILADRVRGNGYHLRCSATDTDALDTNRITSLDSSGFTVGTDNQANGSGNKHVAWCWKKGTTPGFNVITYTGDGMDNRAIAHGLDTTPGFIVVKNRDLGTNWDIYHQSLGITATLTFTTNSTRNVNAFGTTAPNATYFYGNATGDFANSSSGKRLVAYVWAEIAGFSKFGFYTGNGSTDGTFVYCGFKPRYILIKNITVNYDWSLLDSVRNESNPASLKLYPNAAYTENGNGGDNATTNLIDFLSNGFKLRTADGRTNASGSSYIFAAFAEAPFKYATAR